jgi:hypothetical protein
MADLPENWDAMTPDEQEDWLYERLNGAWRERQQKELPAKAPLDKAKGRMP